MTSGPARAGLLLDRVPMRLRLSRRAVLFVAFVGVIACAYCHQPLHHTDLWGHLAYGRLILESKSLPATEPFMPLAEGMPLVDTAWLAQCAGAMIYDHGQAPALQFAHALLIAGCLSLIARLIVRRTRSALFGILGVGLFLAINWYQFEIIRPQMAGLVCFLFLLALVTGMPARRWHPGAMLLLFALWANLHGSFLVGLMYLGCCAAGRSLDAFRERRRAASLIADRGVRRLLVLGAFAAAGACVNPYGLALYQEVLSFSGNPNLNDLIEWDALHFRTLQGQLAMATALALAFACRMTPRRIRAAEILPVIVLGGLALWSARMLIWWTPLATLCLIRHAHAAWRHWKPIRRLATNPRSGRWSVVAAGLVWIFFASTPFGLLAMQSRAIEFRKSVSSQTPVAAVEYLRAHPPAGQVFNTFEWGDYLLWAGPAGTRVFLTSHAHLVPREVWRDYMSVIGAQSHWDEMLDRYGVNTVFVDRRDRGALIARLKDDERWKSIYEDGVAVIYTRTKPLEVLPQLDTTPESQSVSPLDASRAENLRIDRETPLRVKPLYDDPQMVTDAELEGVLAQLVPRFPRSKLRPNFVEHALRIWGANVRFDDPEICSGEELRDFLTDNGRFLASWGPDVKPLIVDAPAGLSIRYGDEEGASVHHDHWLASLTEAGIARRQTLFSPAGAKAAESVLRQALTDFRIDEREVEWSAMAFGLWLPPQKAWRTSDGRIVTFDLLAKRLVRGDMQFGVCSGTHRLYSAVLLLRLDDEFQILSPHVRAAVVAHLELVRDLLMAAQFDDGHWASNWSLGAESKEKPIEDPLHKQVIATGHHLEWLALAPIELHPPREQIRKAARWAIDTTLSHTQEEVQTHYTFYSHIAGALALWRNTHPADFWQSRRTPRAAHPDPARLPEGRSE
jgi:hypothetical protein